MNISGKILISLLASVAFNIKVISFRYHFYHSLQKEKIFSYKDILNKSTFGLNKSRKHSKKNVQEYQCHTLIFLRPIFKYTNTKLIIKKYCVLKHSPL